MSEQKRPRRDPVPQPHGGALIPGAGAGRQPGAGRPKGTFKQFLATLREDAAFRAALKKAASDPDCRNFGAAVKLLAEYDEEKPAEKKQIVGPIEVHVRVAREGRRVTAG